MTTPPSPHTTRSGDHVAPRPAEFRALTGLRIVAAAWVVLFHFHFTGLDGVAAAVDVFGPLVTAGALGVDLFFVLSGFVIAHTYLDRLGPALQVAPTARFVWARACRIWPAYAVVFHLFGIWVVARLVRAPTTRSPSRRCSPSSAFLSPCSSSCWSSCGTPHSSTARPGWARHGRSARSGWPTCCSPWRHWCSTGCATCLSPCS